jgi:uncharacterized protein
MFELWISLKDVPAEGREFHFTDQSLWTGPMREFAVAGRIAKPFAARLSIVPQGEGFLVHGEFAGSLIAPCNRCAEDFELPVASSFEVYEAPEEEHGDAQEDDDEGHLRLSPSGSLELDVAGILWEQFVLALPESPICSEACRGLCPQCGVNRNENDCGCVREEGDPRLAVLRNLKLQ